MATQKKTTKKKPATCAQKQHQLSQRAAIKPITAAGSSAIFTAAVLIPREPQKEKKKKNQVTSVGAVSLTRAEGFLGLTASLY